MSEKTSKKFQARVAISANKSKVYEKDEFLFAKSSLTINSKLKNSLLRFQEVVNPLEPFFLFMEKLDIIFYQTFQKFSPWLNFLRSHKSFNSAFNNLKTLSKKQKLPPEILTSLVYISWFMELID